MIEMSHIVLQHSLLNTRVYSPYRKLRIDFQFAALYRLKPLVGNRMVTRGKPLSGGLLLRLPLVVKARISRRLAAAARYHRVPISAIGTIEWHCNVRTTQLSRTDFARLKSTFSMAVPIYHPRVQHFIPPSHYSVLFPNSSAWWQNECNRESKIQGKTQLANETVRSTVPNSR